MIGCWWRQRKPPGVQSWQSRTGSCLAAAAIATPPAVHGCHTETRPAHNDDGLTVVVVVVVVTAAKSSMFAAIRS